MTKSNPITDPVRHKAIAAALHQVLKYRNVCPDTIERISQWACDRHRSDKEAVKSARRKLHQLYGAYFKPGWKSHLKHQLDALHAANDPDSRRTICMQMLKYHASTAERLPILDQVYQDILSLIPAPKTVLDLACGFNPFSLPWMGKIGAARYTAVDIDSQLLNFITDFSKAIDGNIETEYRDIISSPPSFSVDLALLLKTIPSLYQTDKNAGLRLLKSLNAHYVVVSFPLQTIGGARKGMKENYRQTAEELFRSLGVEFKELIYPSEIFYVYRSFF